MMRKIINDRDPIDNCPNLKPAFDALERPKRLHNRIRRYALPSSKRRSGSSIQRIVLTRYRQAEFSKGDSAAAEHPTRQRSFVTQIRDPPVRVRRKSISLNRTERLRNTLAD